MSKGNGTQPHAVFDELVAVRVPDPAPLTTDNESRCIYGILIVSLGIGVTTTGNEVVALFLEFF
jgi:hypothetical protein